MALLYPYRPCREASKSACQFASSEWRNRIIAVFRRSFGNGPIKRIVDSAEAGVQACLSPRSRVGTGSGKVWFHKQVAGVRVDIVSVRGSTLVSAASYQVP